MAESYEQERIPTDASGFRFTHVPEHVRADLNSLEREQVVYTDHWVESIGDFRHLRIRFTKEECADYVRRAWAYELFLRAGEPKWARDVPLIDQDVAEEADAYEMHTFHGTVIPAPYHCFAAFLGKNLEGLVCSNERDEIIEFVGKEKMLYAVERVINSLTPTIRSFENRERGLSPWPIE